MHHQSIQELETQKKQLYDDMEEIKMRFGGDLEDVTERLEVDLRTSALFFSQGWKGTDVTSGTSSTQ